MNALVYDGVLLDLRHVASETRWLAGDRAHITVHLPEDAYNNLLDDMDVLGGFAPKERWEVAGDGQAVMRMTLLGGALRIERLARQDERPKGYVLV